MTVLAHTRSDKPIPDVDDEKYTHRYKWPKWNRTVSVLDDIPALTRRVFSDYTKQDHLEAAALHARLREEAAGEHGRKVRAALRTYGDEGQWVSGVGRSHFPERTKDDLRFLAQMASLHHAASIAHWHAVKRTPYDESPHDTNRVYVYTK